MKSPKFLLVAQTGTEFFMQSVRQLVLLARSKVKGQVITFDAPPDKKF